MPESQFPRRPLLGNLLNKLFHYMPERPINMFPVCVTGRGLPLFTSSSVKFCY
jgi:hypothetical protein